MGSLLSPSVPAPPPPPPPPPEADDPAIAEARRRQREAELRRRGRAATILTGGLGDTSSAPVRRASLNGRLGGGA